MRWHFFRDDTGSWTWEQESNGDTLSRATSAFADKCACIADARLHGFAGGMNVARESLEEERG